MSFLRPGFIRALGVNPRALQNVTGPNQGLPIIHEEPTQMIQGGSSNQHYHLTAAELALLQRIASKGIPAFSPLVTVSADLIFDNEGNLVLGIGGWYAP